MSLLIHQLFNRPCERSPRSVALVDRKRRLTYEELGAQVDHFAHGLLRLGVARQDRVAIYLPKTLEAVVSLFGAARAGAVFVPVNPLLKPAQVAHILRDSGARVLVTSAARHNALATALQDIDTLTHSIITDASGDQLASAQCAWADLMAAGAPAGHRTIDDDMAAILYTSGSTGRPKGVVLSHRNMATGALSVATYLDNTAEDKLLAVLPFSFDYGFSQLSTAFSVGARVVLLEYLLPRDVVRKLATEKITGLAGVPPLWNQLANLCWPDGAADSLRYFTNSGGAMPKATLQALRRKAPRAKPYLMYGLTEAFRSTYLPPEEIERRPESMGKAIPNAQILVLNKEGQPVAPGETGELVHRGALVSLGYWNDPDKTRARFKPLPSPFAGRVLDEIAVWSGDSVRSDEDGFLYFVGRRDDMIKTSGYRVSPTEIEEILYDAGLVKDVVALGVPSPELGQAVLVVASPRPDGVGDTDALLQVCKENLANFMQPRAVEWLAELPRNPNGKIDRKALGDQFAERFALTQ